MENIIYDGNGELKAGTLNQLIERLTCGSSTAMAVKQNALLFSGGSSGGGNQLISSSSAANSKSPSASSSPQTTVRHAFRRTQSFGSSSNNNSTTQSTMRSLFSGGVGIPESRADLMQSSASILGDLVAASTTIVTELQPGQHAAGRRRSITLTGITRPIAFGAGSTKPLSSAAVPSAVASTRSSATSIQTTTSALNNAAGASGGNNDYSSTHAHVINSEAFEKAFLIAYPVFTTADTLLSKLIDRINVPEESTFINSTQKRRIQIHVTQILLKWMQTFPGDFSDEMINKIRKLAKSLIGDYGDDSDLFNAATAIIPTTSASSSSSTYTVQKWPDDSPPGKLNVIGRVSIIAVRLIVFQLFTFPF